MFTTKELAHAVNTEEPLTGQIVIGLREIFNSDAIILEHLLSEKLIGSDKLENVSYEIVGFGDSGRTLDIEVSGILRDSSVVPDVEGFYTYKEHRTGDIEIFKPNGLSLVYLQGEDDTSYVREALENLEKHEYPVGPFESYEAHLSAILDAYDYD